MKKKVLSSMYPYEYYYEVEKKDDEPSLVEVNKIIGIDTGWITNGRTVYNLFFSVTGEVADSSIESLHYGRIKENIDSLINNGISYQYDFYVDKSKENLLRDGLPKFKFFREDGIFFSGATHRTISAMMFNAPNMIGYITHYKKNHKKFVNFELYEQVNKEWDCFINNELRNIIIKEEIPNKYAFMEQDTYSLKLKGFAELSIARFENPIIEPYYLDFNNTDSIKLYKERVRDLIYKFKEIDELYSKNIKKYTKIPLVFLVLKSLNCYFLYNLLYCLRYQEDVYIHVDQSVEAMAEAIWKKLCPHVIYINRPIKVK
jgi:hypothetical protein